ncbi:MAG: YkgJ family cysteine cluster protein [Elusimicrobia bacterium]|nr:YkgJ family cysteine cluster protein [Elusimicrobiota bacterium]
MRNPTCPDPRPFDPKREDHCSPCTSCCEYVALEIDTPTTWKDFENIRWYLLHENVWVYVDFDNIWHVQFNTPCHKLEKSRCGIYPQRPEICRAYDPKDCPRHAGGAEKHLFTNEEVLLAYLEKRRPAMFKRLKDRGRC